MPKGKEAYRFTEAYKDYKRGAFYWLNPKTGDSYVEQGIAEEYDPDNPTQESNLPDNLPGKDDFDDAGKTLKDVKQLFEDGKLQSVNGIGPKTEEEIKEYFLTQNTEDDE